MDAAQDIEASGSKDGSSMLPWLGGATLLLAAVLLAWRPWRRP
jgi:hypothetical protein